MSLYPNLNTHSYYSFLSSCLSLEQIINYSLEHNLKYACLVDENVVYGVFEFYKLCKANDLKPIIGLKINYEDSELVLIAKNLKGYQQLIKISSKIMTNTEYQLKEYLSENLFLINLSGNFTWEHPNSFSLDEDKENCIACHEVYYLNPNDFDAYLLLNAIKENKILNPEILETTNSHLCFYDDLKMQEMYSQLALNNLLKVVEQIDLNLDSHFEKNVLKFDVPAEYNSKTYLEKLVNQSLTSYLNTNKNLDKQKYLTRLEYELNVINEKGFNDYFLIVQDFINWAKNRGIIVGPGRGSAAGSLVAFLLRITEIDPIKYHLLFERFLNKERVSMPDIDTDIMDTRRDEVIDYLFNKYGEDHVAHIITFSKIKAKTAIRDVARVLNTDLKTVNKICKNIDSEYEEDLEKAIRNSPTLLEEALQNQKLFALANKIIGVPRQFGTHAAGIILSNSKLEDVIGVQTGLNNHNMCQFSMEHLEELGLIKMDLLGLRNLTILNNILILINHTNKQQLTLKDIPLDDVKTFELLATAETNGIFQLESDGMRRILKRMKPQCIEDISIVLALYRPGAMQHINLYLNRRKTNNHPEYLNDEIKKVLAPTYGVIIYQEQIIKLVQIIANFNGEKSDNFRRAISKKKEETITAMKSEFILSAVNNGYEETQALEYFEYMEAFASYGFNHSHSLAYSYISYWLSYLKTNYPLETISVLMSFGDASKEKIAKYLEESKALNIEIKGPDINLSSTNFVIDNKNIIFSFLSIPGLGNETAKKIIKLREERNEKCFNDALKTIALLSNNGISKKVIEALIKVGSFDQIDKRRNFLLENLEKLTDSKLNLIDKNNNFIFNLDLNEKVVEDETTYYQYEKDLLGVSFSNSKFQTLYETLKNSFNLKSLKDEPKRTFNTLIEIKSITLTKTSTNKPMLKWTVSETEKTYTLYSFDNLDELKIKSQGKNYLVCSLKLSKTSYVLTEILWGE